ncbi:MAG: hypothetical protein KJO28_00760 [Desulfofustis sp.]|nr:hypothetical protein [Desulfofustis sp.]NNK58136.1 hypothetical protein [Desulfofustis sp.]
MQKLEKNLQRLTFRVWGNLTEDSEGWNSETHDFSFIYGIGTDGLSDFEMAIDGLGLNDVINLEIAHAKLKSYFGWLCPTLETHVPLVSEGGVVNLKLELLTVSSPEPREIVTAIAELQSHGGCSSDCGCGCH